MPVGVAVPRRRHKIGDDGVPPTRQRRKIRDGGEPLTPPANPQKKKGEREEVMDRIRAYYRTALARLPPSLIPRVLEAGVCFGFRDPVSNIIANTVSYKASPDEKEEEEQGRLGKKRNRSQPGTSSKEEKTGSVREEAARAMSMISEGASSIAARSLQGLIAFLTCYFRYLHTWEALRYLCLSKADLLVAVNLIQRDLGGMHALSAGHPTTKVALTCAAHAALHPHPDALVSSSIALASRLGEVSTLLATRDRLSRCTVSCPFQISTESELGETDPEQLLSCAAERFNRLRVKVVPPLFRVEHERHMKKVLLDKIHGFYLEAICRIPTTLLRSCLHRALLKAGHCYGPFDPVANIIFNTIWYNTIFPMQEELQVDMIRTESLALVEFRSLNGLVAFLRALSPVLTTYDALMLLLCNNARLDQVISTNREFSFNAPDSAAAYKAAATTARHPDPTVIANFAAVLLPAVEATLKPLLEAKPLSPGDTQTISVYVSKNCPPRKPVGQVQELIASASQIVSTTRDEFMAHQRLVRKRVEAALQEHARTQGDDYELHAICGVNSEISEDGRYGYFLNYDGYPYSHINIWVRRRGPHHAADAPMLLFIECCNDCEDVKVPPLLCPVSESWEDSGRCFHCEHAGDKIVHPFSKTYRGQSRDFVDMACGKCSVGTDELVKCGEMGTVFVDVAQLADFFYFDPVWDTDSAKFTNWFLSQGGCDGREGEAS